MDLDQKEIESPVQPELLPATTEKKKDSWWDIIKFALITIAIVIPIRLYVAQPFIVSGASMDTTFANGQYLIVDELSYLLRDPKRGDVTIFKFPNDPSLFFIKRVVGLPGETLQIKNGVVYIQAVGTTTPIRLTEPYVNNVNGNIGPITLKADEYYVMGDNRDQSYDSRFWGPVPRDLFRGRALLRLFPPNTIGILPGYYDYQSANSK